MNKILLIICTIIFISCNENREANIETVVEDGTAAEKEVSPKKEMDYKEEIVPGKRLGTIVLNQNSATVLDSLGKPDSGDAAMGKTVTIWHKDSDNLLALYTTTQMGVEDFSRIKAIRSLSPKYRTEDNIGVNSSLSEIETHFDLEKIGTFKKDRKLYVLYATDEGLGFEIGEGEKCRGIVLTEKGKNPIQQYLTFYSDFKKGR